MFKQLVQFMAFVVYVRGNCDDVLMTRIKYGEVRGQHLEVSANRRVAAYTGIPYAKPPIGELRFKPPEELEPWKDILDATNSHPACAQINTLLMNYTLIGQEDCLYLNVYTPATKQKIKNLPVMIWIHGGWFMTGSASMEYYNPLYLLRHNVILVTVNYRLGAFGWLSTGDGYVLGNNGLKDQILALKWVIENIGAFGGSCEKITVFGQQAGAVIAHLLALSPESRDLFEAVILQSGTALSPWAVHCTKEAETLTKKYAKILNCPIDTSERLVNCLLKKRTKALAVAHKKLIEWDVDPVVTFRPVVELGCDDETLNEAPDVIIQNGLDTNLTMIIGMTHDEGAFRASGIESRGLWEALDNNSRSILETMVPLKHIKQQIQFYFDCDPISEKKKRFVKYISDAFFTYGLDRTINLHRSCTNHTVYNYLFSYRGSFSYGQLLGPDISTFGVCDGDELQYIFPNTNMTLPTVGRPSKYDKKVMRIMSRFWTNFAKYGNPTPDSCSTQSAVVWKPVKGTGNRYLEIEGPCCVKMKKELWPGRLKFWRNYELENTC